MRHPLLSRVRRTIAEHRLAGAGTRVLVAISGGPDSVALAHVVAEIAAAGEIELAGLAHFNHRLRASAARDEEFCRGLAASLDVPIDVDGADVAALAAAGRRSIEAVAHDARYAFLEAARRRLGARVVALGHTRDDQAETFLLRLLRGAGPRGLAAMHPRNGVFVRPLLDCRRGELVAWLAEHDRPFVVDETNADTAVPRNRVRASLIPLLESSFNPSIVDVLADEAALARDDWDWIQDAADGVLAEAATIGPERVEIDAARLARSPMALRRAVLWRAMLRLTGRPVDFAHVCRAAALLDESREGASLHLPGQIVKRSSGGLVLMTRRSANDEARRPGANLFTYPLSIPGEVFVPEANAVVSAEEVTGAQQGRPGLRAHEAVLRRDLCGGVLTVRNRRPGDRLRPVGLGGRKKLQDIFVDRKVARDDRDRIPLVVDDTGRILWVAGVGIADEFRVIDPAQPMLILRFKVLGGSV